MGDDRVEVELSPTGSKVSVSGGGVSRLTNSLSDLVSPFSQALGAIGDHVRIYRERSVKRALERARDISASRKEPIRSVSLKNLLPWMENASMEADEDEGMTDLWARLLLSADEKFDAELAIFTDSLKRLGPAEAKLLEQLCQLDGERKRGRSVKYEVPFTDLLDRLNRRLIQIKFETLPKRRRESKFEKDVSDLLAFSELKFAKITDVDSNVRKDASFIFVSDAYLEEETATLCLAREGLAATKCIMVDTVYGQTAVNYTEATPLGVRLITRCYPELTKPRGT